MQLSSLFHKIGFDIDYKALETLDAKLELAKQDAEKTFGSLSKIAKGVGQIGQALSLWVTAPILGFGALAVKTAADVEQMQLSLKGLIPAGKDVNAIFKDLDRFSLHSVFDRSQVYEYASALLAVKVPAEEITSILKKFGDINALNPSSKGRSDIKQMVEAFSAMRTNGKIELERLRGFGPAVMMQLQNQLGMSGVMFSQFMQSGIVDESMVMNAINSVALKNRDKMNDQMQTLGELFHSLGKSMSFLSSEIGKQIVHDLHLKGVLTLLNNTIFGLSEKFKALPGFIRTGILGFVGLIAVVGPLLLLIGGISLGVMNLITNLTSFATTFKAMMAALNFTKLFAVIGPWLLWALAIAAIGTALWLLYDDISNWVKGNKSLIGNMLGPWKEWRDSIVGFIDDVKMYIKDLFNLFKNPKKFFEDDMGLLWKTGSALFTGNANSWDRAIGIGGQQKTNNINTNVTVSVPHGTTEAQSNYLVDVVKKTFDEAIYGHLNNANRSVVTERY